MAKPGWPGCFRKSSREAHLIASKTTPTALAGMWGLIRMIGSQMGNLVGNSNIVIPCKPFDQPPCDKRLSRTNQEGFRVTRLVLTRVARPVSGAPRRRVQLLRLRGGFVYPVLPGGARQAGGNGREGKPRERRNIWGGSNFRSTPQHLF